MQNNENINEYEIMPDSTERFLIKVDDIEQSMGLWYSLFARRILPFLLYIIPVNVVLGRLNGLINRYYPNPELFGTILLVMWIVVMMVFLVVLIFAPKLGTVLEFALGFAYLFLAFRFHIYNNLLGYSVLICMILFLLVKTVFLVFKIIRMRAFADDKKKNIERDESGRIVRASKEQIYFTADENTQTYENSSAADNEFVFESENAPTEEEDRENAVKVDDDVFFATDYDDGVDEERGRAISESNDDFFFG